MAVAGRTVAAVALFACCVTIVAAQSPSVSFPFAAPTPSSALWTCLQNGGFNTSLDMYLVNGTNASTVNFYNFAQDGRFYGYRFGASVLMTPILNARNGTNYPLTWIWQIMMTAIQGNFLWVRVQDPQVCGTRMRSSCWYSNTTQNAQYLSALITDIQQNILWNVQAGILTSSSDWSRIMGNTKQFANVSLAYVNPNSQPNFKDWKPNAFGGWQSAAMKVYKQNVNMCGTVLNLEVYNTTGTD